MRQSVFGIRTTLGKGAAIRQCVDNGRASLDRVKSSVRLSKHRHAGDELFCIGMGRSGQNFLRRTRFHDLATIHDRNPITHGGDHTEIMGDEENADIALLPQFIE